ncbi:MAG: glycosyltransferase [Pannonibacter phragmitetus]
MILLTVGTQLPFDRLVEAVDRIAPELNEPVIAQVGKSKYVCRNIEAHENFGPVEFQEYLKTCSKIIAHAGIGTILNAKKFGKPIVLVPRLARFGEHRNDHQLATCRSLEKRAGIYVYDDPGLLSAASLMAATEPVSSSGDEPNKMMLMNVLKEVIGR